VARKSNLLFVGVMLSVVLLALIPAIIVGVILLAVLASWVFGVIWAVQQIRLAIKTKKVSAKLVAKLVGALIFLAYLAYFYIRSFLR
jgi:hypothetical protein